MRRLPVVDRLRVRSPCDVPWETMEARDAGRYCVHCTRVVHDVATMSRAEARALAAALDRGERICRRVSRRRSDGAILTAEGFILPEVTPRATKRLVAMATAASTALAACAGPELSPATQAKAPPKPLVITPLPANTQAPSVAPEEPRALPPHAAGEAPEPPEFGWVPPFPGPAVVAPIGPPAPPKKEKPAPPGKAKPVKPVPAHELDVTGGY